LAEVYGSGSRVLSDNEEVPKKRDIWSDQSTATCSCAAVSIPANIAEGRERQHTKEFIQHLSIAYGSLAELETHILIGQRLNYLDSTQEKQLLEKTAEIGRMINGLRRSLEKKS
jgi:four helix bundle protein